MSHMRLMMEKALIRSGEQAIVIASRFFEMVRPYILIFLFSMATKKSAPATNKIRITVKSFEHKLVDDATGKIVATAKESGAVVIGPVPLPTKIEKITLNRSTFVNKDAREQFEIRRHKRLIDVLDPTPKTLELLQSLSIPSGVGVEIKVM